MNELGKLLIFSGTVLLLLGLALVLGPRARFYMPLATSILLSIVLTIILNLLLRR